uniref:Uncharacterized protein n=1 Tax=Yersinia pestis TaxID=632 RepID=A0A0K1H0L0_YERPE|nr:hypothetical protein [Yersinia pestis]
MVFRRESAISAEKHHRQYQPKGNHRKTLKIAYSAFYVIKVKYAPF